MAKVALTTIRKRINATRGKRVVGEGEVTREDISDALLNYKESKDKEADLKEFLDSLDDGVISDADKHKILKDIGSYKT